MMRQAAMPDKYILPAIQKIRGDCSTLFVYFVDVILAVPIHSVPLVHLFFSLLLERTYQTYDLVCWAASVFGFRRSDSEEQAKS
jgi:hypothetical protein